MKLTLAGDLQSLEWRGGLEGGWRGQLIPEIDNGSKGMDFAGNLDLVDFATVHLV